MTFIQVIFAYSAKAEVPDIDVNKLISPRDLRMKQEVEKQNLFSSYVSFFCYTVLQYNVLPDLLTCRYRFLQLLYFGFLLDSAH